jgi:hypothetical protein
MKYPLSLITVIVLTILSSATPAYAQGGMVRKGVTELIEYFTKSGAKQSAKELAEIGGEKAVQEVLEKAAKEGGDELVGQVVSLSKRGGPRTLQALGPDPALMTKALRGLPEGQLADSVIETARNPALMAKLVRSHGDEAIVAAARHPGIGTQVIDEFGEAGLKATRELGTDQVIVLAKTKGFRDLPAAAQQKFVGLLDRDPRAVTNLIKLARAGTVIVLTADFVNKLEAEILGKGGRLTKAMVFYGWVTGGVLVAALALYLWIKIRRMSGSRQAAR